jgi:hypothetical protein
MVHESCVERIEKKKICGGFAVSKSETVLKKNKLPDKI